MSDSNPTDADAESEVLWRAVVDRVSSSDGLFVYAVKTTGIFCLPSCPSRKPKRQNVMFYPTCDEAIRGGFRPCKRCQPQQRPVGSPRNRIVENTCRMIESSDEKPDLRSLAEAAGLSQYHFQRLFKSVTGVTPQDYNDSCRDQRMKFELLERSSVTEAAFHSGFNSLSRFYAQAARALGMAPSAFRGGGGGEQIRFALAQCTLGAISVAGTDAGVCSIMLGDDPGTLLANLQDQFPNAELVGGDRAFEEYVAAVLSFVETPLGTLELPLDIQGTVFQRRVWKELQRTRLGEKISYSDLAKRLGLPNGARAVARACGANRLAVAIPCHRVVRLDESLSGYRWGIERKTALLRREQAAHDPGNCRREP